MLARYIIAVIGLCAGISAAGVVLPAHADSNCSDAAACMVSFDDGNPSDNQGGDSGADRKAEHGDQHGPRHHPARQAERLEGDLAQLQHDPRDDRIGRRRTHDLAAAQLVPRRLQQRGGGHGGFVYAHPARMRAQACRFSRGDAIGRTVVRRRSGRARLCSQNLRRCHKGHEEQLRKGHEGLHGLAMGSCTSVATLCPCLLLFLCAL